ncbi:MAG: zf-TFIIB domain-containing protein [Candidatus Aceula meridiana]|nr:zf-TFIIB domain-containing protein [Candidatus Aceula meridiana]
MQCPACKIDMVEKDFGGVKVDVCENGCNGIWFDWLELEKLDEKHEGLGNALDQALASDRHKNDNRGRINCPKCSQPMVQHLYKSSKMVTVDECYGCAGFYLDSGELEIIRENFMSEEDRKEYVDQILAGDLDFREAIGNFEENEKSLNPGAGKRAAAVTKFVGVLGNKFRA